MLPALVDPTGALYINTVAPQVGDAFFNGIAVTPEGAVRATAAAPEVFVNGVGVRNVGAICIAPGGAVAGYICGLPATVDGRLVTQLNQPVSPGDAYVSSFRVGPLGGLYTTDVAPPPPNGFTAGFDGGFD